MSSPKPKRKHKSKRKPEKDENKPQPRFAPAAFLSGSAESVQQLCNELAALAAGRFKDLRGTTWDLVGTSMAEQLRAIGHDLSNFDQAEGLQEWQATWHLPRGTFSLFLTFRAPSSVEVIWKTDDATFTAREE